MTKKILSLVLGAAMCLSLLAACGTPAADPTPTPTEPALTGEELATLTPRPAAVFAVTEANLARLCANYLGGA